MPPEKEKMFFDNSVLSDYCRIHARHHDDADKVLSEYDGEMWVSEFGEKRFDEETTNRQRLFGYLKREIGKILSDDDLSDAEKQTQITNNILDFEEINKNVAFPMKDKYRPLIGHLKKYIKDESSRELIKRIDRIKRAARSRESELKRVVIDKRQQRHSEPLLRAYISGNVENEIQAKIVVDAVYWSRKTGGKYFTARDTAAVYVERDEVNKGIEAKFTKSNTLEICSTTYIVKQVGL